MLQRARDLFRRYPWVILFVLFIGVYTIFDLAHMDKRHSELENRDLAKRPELTWDVLMEGTYDENYDTYVSDQFYLRDAWITLKSAVESLLLKAENNGVVYGRDDYLFVKYDTLDDMRTPGRFAQNERYIREFFEMYPEQPVAFGVVPNGYAVLGDKLPRGVPLVDQPARIAGLYGELPGNVAPLDLVSPLREAHAAQPEAQLYYRTDHHWTTYGAYLAARAYAQSRGLALPAWDDLEKNEEPGFFGTSYSKAKKLSIPPDTITWCAVPTQSVQIAGEERGGLMNMEKFSEPHDKYAAFLWGNNNLTEIRARNNQNARPDGEPTRVLLIKDSYGNCFAPFLTYLYDEVDVVDLRFFADLKKLFSEKRYDDVLLLYNFESLASDPYLFRLRY